MKNNLFLAGVLLLLVSCTQPADNSESNLQLIEKYIEAVESVDTNAMDDLLAEDYLGLGPSYGDSIG